MNILNHKWTCGNCGKVWAGNIFYCSCEFTDRPTFEIHHDRKNSGVGIHHDADFSPLIFRAGLGIEPHKITNEMVTLVLEWGMIWNASVNFGQTFYECYQDAARSIRLCKVCRETVIMLDEYEEGEEPDICDVCYYNERFGQHKET